MECNKQLVKGYAFFSTCVCFSLAFEIVAVLHSIGVKGKLQHNVSLFSRRTKLAIE